MQRYPNNQSSNDGNKICTHCGHLAMDIESLNLHLMIHEKERKQTLSEQQWKYHLIGIIRRYCLRVKDFENKIDSEMQKYQKPILPPRAPLDPEQVYGIPQTQHQSNTNENNNNPNSNNSNFAVPSLLSNIGNNYANVTVPGLDTMESPQQKQSQQSTNNQNNDLIAQVIAALKGLAQQNQSSQLQDVPPMQPIPVLGAPRSILRNNDNATHQLSDNDTESDNIPILAATSTVNNNKSAQEKARHRIVTQSSLNNNLLLSALNKQRRLRTQKRKNNSK